MNAIYLQGNVVIICSTFFILPFSMICMICNILNIMCNTTSHYHLSILPCNITFHPHVQYSSYHVQYNTTFQYYLAILPFTIMYNTFNIMCNTTSQYYLSSSCALFLMSCAILLLNVIANLFSYLYFSFRLIHCTFIIVLFLFLCCWYFWATSGKCISFGMNKVFFYLFTPGNTTGQRWVCVTCIGCSSACRYRCSGEMTARLLHSDTCTASPRLPSACHWCPEPTGGIPPSPRDTQRCSAGRWNPPVGGGKSINVK